MFLFFLMFLKLVCHWNDNLHDLSVTSFHCLQVAHRPVRHANNLLVCLLLLRRQSIHRVMISRIIMGHQWLVVVVIAPVAASMAVRAVVERVRSVVAVVARARVSRRGRQHAGVMNGAVVVAIAMRREDGVFCGDSIIVMTVHKVRRTSAAAPMLAAEAGKAWVIARPHERGRDGCEVSVAVVRAPTAGRLLLLRIPMLRSAVDG